MATYVNNQGLSHHVEGLFGWRDAQTWRNVTYLLLAFPLGVAYFVFLVTGIALGSGLAITLLGLPILVLMMLAWRWLGVFERGLTSTLLNVPIEHDAANEQAEASMSGLIDRVRRDLTDSFTWRSVVYLFIKYPFGIASFVVTVTLLSVGFALALAPAYYWIVPRDESSWSVDTFPKAVLASVVGVAVLWLTAFVVNGAARLWGAFAQMMLAQRSRDTLA